MAALKNLYLVNRCQQKIFYSHKYRDSSQPMLLNFIN